MEDDFEVELENNQPEAGSETPENEEPVEADDKHDQPSDDSKDKAASEAAAKEEKAGAEKKSPDKPKFDDDLAEWAEKKGLEIPETEKELTYAQKLRDQDRQFTKDREVKKGAKSIDIVLKDAQKEVPKKDDEDVIDPLEKKVATLEKQHNDERAMRLRSEFVTANDISDETSTVMADILKEKFEKATSVESKQRIIDHYADPDNLQDWYDLAKARQTNSIDKTQIEEEAAKKERARIAKLDKAGSTQRNAKQTVPKDTQSELDKLWED